MRTASFAAVALAGTIAVAAAGGAARFPAPELAFATDRAENLLRAQLYSIRLDGTHRRRVAVALPRLLDFVRSLDGRKLVFARGTSPATLYLRNLLTGAERRLTPSSVGVSQAPRLAVFSPNGSLIAFTGCRDLSCTRGHVMTVRANGTHLLDIASGSDPDWSPDGRQIVYARGPIGEAAELHVIRAGGSGDRRPVKGKFVAEPRWSPRGDRIAFANYTVDPTGRRLRRVGPLGLAVYFPLWSPNGRLIAFERSVPDGPLELVVTRADSSHLRVLAQAKGTTFRPVAWSPDSRRLVVVRGRGQAAQLVIFFLATAHSRRVTHEPPGTSFADVRFLRSGRALTYGALLVANDLELAVTTASGVRLLTNNRFQERSPSWSPDGSKIVFARTEGALASSVLFVVRAEGTGLRRLTRPGRARDSYPAWSPDGTRIAFVRQARVPPGPQLEIVGTDGTNLTAVPTPPVDPTRISWSPDGERLAFTGQANQLYTVRLDGSDLVPLAPSFQVALAPSWAPNADRILFSGEPRIGDRMGLYVVDVARGKPRRIAENVFPDGGTWSPDGAQVAFVRGQFPSTQIVVADADGGHETTVTSDTERNLSPAWRPPR